MSESVASWKVLRNVYLLREIFSWIEKPCHIGAVCKLWFDNKHWTNPETSYVRLLEKKKLKEANELFFVLKDRLTKSQRVFDAACQHHVKRHVEQFFVEPHEMCVLLDTYGFDRYLLFCGGNEQYRKNCCNAEMARSQNRVPVIDVFQYLDVALMYTIEAGNFHIVKVLLDNPAVYLGDVNHPAPTGNKVLFWTCAGGYLPMVERLLQDSRFMPSAIKFAIVSACANGHLGVVERLLRDKRVDPSVLQNKALRLAVENNHVEVVRCLMRDSRVDPSSKNNEAVCCASKLGFWQLVCQLLKDKRVDPAAKNNFPLCSACRNGHFNVVDALLNDQRVCSYASNNSPVVSASGNGHCRIVARLLQEAKVDPSAQKNAAVRSACKHGHLSVVKTLLQDPRVDPSSKQNEALCKAQQNGQLEIVKLLLNDARVRSCLAALAAEQSKLKNKIK